MLRSKMAKDQVQLVLRACDRQGKERADNRPDRQRDAEVVLRIRGERTGHDERVEDQQKVEALAQQILDEGALLTEVPGVSLRIGLLGRHVGARGW